METKEYLTFFNIDRIAKDWIEDNFTILNIGAYTIEAFNDNTKQLFTYCEGDISEKTYSDIEQYKKDKTELIEWVAEYRQF